MSPEYPDADVKGLKTVSYEAFPSDWKQRQLVFGETGDFSKIGREGGDYTRFCGGSSTIFTVE